MQRSLTTLTAAGLLALPLAGPASAAKIVDFGGDYVATDTTLPDGVNTTPTGTDNTFSVVTNDIALNLNNQAGGDEFIIVGGNNSDDYMVTWSAEDVAGGGAGYVFDLTGLASNGLLATISSPQDVPSHKIVVEVDGQFYASKQNKTNDASKNWLRGDIEGDNPDFGLVNTSSLAVDTSGNPGTFVSFADLDSVTAIGFLVTANSGARAINGAEFYGELVIPEPASLALLGLGGLCLLSGRRRAS